jgi:tyrosine-protein kinase Etk/Wzc
MTTPNFPPSGYPDPYDPMVADDNLDLKRFLSLFVSNWYWFAISFFIGLTIVYGINRYGDKVYLVSSTLLIKDDQKGGATSSSENFIVGSPLFNSQQNLLNEMGILKSYSLNVRVMNSLPDFRMVYYGVGKRKIVESILYRRSPFKVITDSIDFQPNDVRIYIKITSDTTYILDFDGRFNDAFKMKFGESYRNRNFSFKISLRDPRNFKYNPEISNKYFFYFERPEILANLYRNKLSVNPIDKEATLLNLSVAGSIEEQEVDYLNKLMDVYINQGLELKNQIADSAYNFIDRQLNIISDSLSKAEDKLQNFKLENKLVDISKEGSIIQSRIEEFDNQRSSLFLQLEYYNYLDKYLNMKDESGDIISPSIMGVTDQSLGRLVQELSSLQKKKKELMMNFSGDLQPVNLIEENIVTTKKALYEDIKNSIINIENSISELNRRIAQTDIEVKKLPETERKLINIQRKFDINNTIYTYLLEKRAETGIAKASNVSNNKIIDRADVINSIQLKPDVNRNKIKAVFFSLFLPAFLIVLLYLFNNRIIDNRDITRKTKVPIIGYISHNDYKDEIPVSINPGSSLAESFRAVRTSLRYFIKSSDNPVIAVTSTISSEGKTFMSINLAAITAMLGKKVLLIGLDLRRPRIHKILGMENNEGMSTYLSNNCDYGSVIRSTKVENLFYAVSGPIPPNPSELINSERMREFILKAKEEYDFVIIDTPPIAVVSDTLLLSDLVDVNVFVVRQRFSSKNTLELIQDLYQGEKLKNMGIIINDISLTGYYGYGLRYGYYKGYGYSYGKDYYGRYSYSRYGYNDKDHNYYNT